MAGYKGEWDILAGEVAVVEGEWIDGMANTKTEATSTMDNTEEKETKDTNPSMFTKGRAQRRTHRDHHQEKLDITICHKSDKDLSRGHHPSCTSLGTTSTGERDKASSFRKSSTRGETIQSRPKVSQESPATTFSPSQAHSRLPQAESLSFSE